MSRNIDENVVEMRFENEQFEKAAATSIKTVDKLKSMLNFKGAEKGFEEVEASAKKLDFSVLSHGVETVKSKFSALEVVAVIALANITNSTVNAGKQLLNSLTVAPIKQGYDEYELKLDSVQTIMASTGASISEVTGYLEELNTYADKTIYSFSDMTANIGKFTNAGVGLKSAVKAIQGISNEAAVSGANANEASRAMYNFAQALSSGSVKLIDWKSIELANMGTVEFKEELMKTAVELGTIVKVGDKYRSTTTDANGNVSELFTSTTMFNNSLSSQWMTTEVLVETLGRYADETTEIGKKSFAAAQDVKKFTQLIDTLREAVGSGWAQTWEILCGDLEEAKVLWTDISKVIGGFIDAQSDARNELLSVWDDLGGRTVIIDAFKNAFDGVRSVVQPVSEAFREIFPPATAEQLFKITENIRDFTAKLKLSDENAQKLKDAFKGLFSVIKILTDIIKTAVVFIFSLGKNLSKAAEIGLNASSAMGRWLDRVRELTEQSDIFRRILDKLDITLQKVVGKVKEFFATARQKIDSSGLTFVAKTVRTIFDLFVKLGGIAVRVGKSIGGVLLEAFRNGDISSIIDIINGGLFAKILSNIKNFTNGLSGAFDGISEILDSVKGSLEAWQKSIQAGTLSKIAKSIAILSASLLVLSLINSEKLTSSLAAITVMFAQLTASMRILDKGNAAFSGAAKTATAMIAVSASILILANAMKKLGALDWEGISRGIAGISVLVLVITGAANSLSKIDGKIIKGSASLVIFSSAVAVLASVCKSLAKLNVSELTKGLLSVSALVLVMTGAARSLSKIDGKIIKGSASLVIFSSAIAVLASVCKNLAKLRVEELAKGLLGVTALSAVILAVSKSLSKIDGKIVKGSASLVIFSSALAILAGVCKNLASLNWEELARGLTGIAGLTAAIMFVSKAKTDFVKGAASFVIVGAAFSIIAEVVKKLGNMSLGNLAIGLTAFGGTLFILSKGLKALKGTIGGAAALTVVAAALVPLSAELKLLSGLKMSGIATALIALSGTFTVLGVSAKCLKPLAGTMAKVAGAISLLGVGCALAGTGILAFSIALTTLSASLVIASSSFGTILSGLFDGVANSASSLSNMFVALIKSACVTLKETAPLIADTLLTVILETLKTLSTNAPQIIDTIIDVVIEILDKLSVKTPELVNSLANVLQNIAESLDKAIGKGGWEKLLFAITSISAVFLALAGAAKIISSIKLKGMMSGLAGFGVAVAGMVGILAVLGGLAQIPGLSWLVGEGSKIFSMLGQALGAFVGGLVNGFVKKFPKDLSSILNACVGVESIALAIAPLSGIIGKLDIKGTAKGMAGFGIIVGGLSVILAAIGGLKQIPGFEWLIDEGGNLLCKLGEILGKTIGTFIDSISSSITAKVEDTANALASCSAVIIAIAAVAKVVGKLKIDPASVAIGFAGVATAIGCITLVLAAMGAIKNIPGIEWLLNEGGKLLCSIGSILGEFVGSIVSGLGVGLTSGLPKIGENLSAFMTSITPFIEGAKNIDERAMKSIGTLIGAILALTAADLLNSITSFLTGSSSITKFGKEIGEFGVSLKKFSDNVNGINVNNVQAAANAGKELAEMTNAIPNEGGVAGFFAGNKSLSKFSNDISAFGGSISEFSKKVAGVKPKNVEAAANAGKALAEMTETIPNEGGVAQFFAGSKSLAKFSSEIGAFGTAILAFSQNSAGAGTEQAKKAAEVGKILAEMTNTIPNDDGVSQFFAGSKSLAKFSNEIGEFGTTLSKFSSGAVGVDPDKARTAAEVGKILAEMTNTIPNEGGIAGFFAGSKSLSSFGDGISEFGAGMTKFSESVSSMNADTEKVRAAAEAGKILSEMTATIPTEGGIEKWFSGEVSLSKFGTEIANLGTALSNFSFNVSNVNEKNVSTAVEAAKAIADMTNTVPNEGGVAQFFAGSKSLSKLGDEMARLGGNIATFSYSVKNIDDKKVEVAANAAKTIADGISVLPDSATDNLGSALVSAGLGIQMFANTMASIDTYSASAKVSDLAALGEKIQNNGFEGFAKLSSALAEAGNNGVSCFVKAFDGAEETVKNTIANFTNNAMSKIPDAKAKYVYVGEMLAKGFAEGLSSGASYAAQAAEKMADSALEAAKRKLDIHSPSREAFKMGSLFDDGFAGGIWENAGKAEDAGAGVAEKAKNGLNNVISKVTDFAMGKMDVQPTITPVLDLSEVESQSKSIDTMFSHDQAVKVDAGITSNAISRDSGSSSSSSSSFTFTQNITSPKAVDAKTIYRQTRNQFSRMTEAIKRL